MRLRPLEALNFATLAVLALLTLALHGRLSDPGAILLRYAEMAAGLAVIAAAARNEAKLPATARFVLNFYPMAFIPILYESLGPLIVAANPVARDALLLAADRALFGTDPTVWLERFLSPFLTDLFFLAYLSYYFIAIALGAVLWKRKPAEAKRFIFTLTVAYLISYAGYFLVPALGPRVSLANRHGQFLATTAISRTVSVTLDELEHTKFDVFPSGHTMIAVVVLVVSFQRARDAFWWLLPIGVLLIISTVYCRFHYVVDLIAGTVLALAAVPIGDRLYERWNGRSKVQGPRSKVGI
ncbi:MAG TPA: phosphatase PAP2 family protein [Thermoanaerobaculia bacterium]|jgi:membrane-associated phospholipid phosphatase|nr:phosphatase PAP2 family protein [Thermoanaerobaculia bacterium]